MITCSKDLGSVLRVDRTSAITFKNNKVMFRNNNSNHVFLGPCFLHKNSKEEEYDHFIKLTKNSYFPEFDFSKLSFVTDGSKL